jgi:hypothetical protein
MQSLSPSDLNFVLSRCPRDILKLIKDNAGKLFLAGGFIRATIAGEKVSDVDLFGTTHDDLLRIAKDLTLERKGRFFETKNAITVLAPPRFPAQFITRWLFDVPEKLVESFDFTVCQSVIWAEALPPVTEMVEGKPVIKQKYRFHSFCSDAFYADLAARRLVYTHPIRSEEAGGSLMRVLKFVKKGYNIQAPSLAGTISRLVGHLVEKGLTKKDGSVDEKWAAQVITGLLREVDPLILIDGATEFVDEHEVIEAEPDGKQQ